MTSEIKTPAKTFLGYTYKEAEYETEEVSKDCIVYTASIS